MKTVTHTAAASAAKINATTAVVAASTAIAATLARPSVFRVFTLLLAGTLLFGGAVRAQDDDALPGRLIFEAVALPEQQNADAVPGSAFATSDDTSADAAVADDGSIARYRRQLDELLSAADLYAESRREQFESLGVLLQQQGEHEEALAAFGEALHIERVNRGLYTLTQLQLVDRILESHIALNNFSDVDDYHAYRYYVEQKAYPADDPRLLAAKEAWADWNVESYLKQVKAPSGFSINAGPGGPGGTSGQTEYVAIQNPVNGTFNYVPRNQLPSILGPGSANRDFFQNSSALSVSAEMLVDERLRTASKLYEELQEVQGSEPDPDLARKRASIDLAIKEMIDETETVGDSRSLYYNRVFQTRTPPPLVTRGYSRNRDALELLATSAEADAASNPLAAANAYLDLGDWHISYDYTRRAEEAYAKAWNILQESGLSPTEIADIFAPAPLMPVPTFASHPYSRKLYGVAADAKLVYKGYIDMSLTLNKAGSIRASTIDAVSEGTTQRMRSALLDYVREQKMRPALVNGEPVERSDMKVRFYYAY